MGFKKGDRVRVNKIAVRRWRKKAMKHGSTYEPACFGKIGKVMEVYPDRHPRLVRVKFDGQYGPFREDDIELA